MKITVRPQFYLDLEQEVYWLAEHAGPEVAIRWHKAVWQTLEQLSTHPRLGRERSDLKHPGIRSWRVQHFTRWLIFYGVEKSELIFYRVRSGTTNLLALRMKN